MLNDIWAHAVSPTPASMFYGSQFQLQGTLDHTSIRRPEEVHKISKKFHPYDIFAGDTHFSCFTENGKHAKGIHLCFSHNFANLIIKCLNKHG